MFWTLWFRVYKFFRVAGQRAAGQKLVAFPLDAEFLAALDRARGTKSRSALVREAIYEHLKAMGYQLPKSVRAAPDRAGKGGRPPKVVPIEMPMARVAEDEVPLPPTTMKKVTYPKGKKR